MNIRESRVQQIQYTSIMKKDRKPKDLWGKSYTTKSWSEFSEHKNHPRIKGRRMASIPGLTLYLAAVFSAALARIFRKKSIVDMLNC